ncbi:hypothetical protein ACS0TY_032515 [Phlomoides rotata]
MFLESHFKNIIKFINCDNWVTAVDGQYQIEIYSVRPIGYGEEITFDYNSVTESKEQYQASVCLCGNQVCRGSYLNLTGEGAFQKVLKEHHGLLDRHRLLLEACELNSVSEEDYIDLSKAGLGSCLLGGLPDWLIAYSARLVRFINFERTKLPNEILKHNIEEKKRYFAEINLDVEKSDAEILFLKPLFLMLRGSKLQVDKTSLGLPDVHRVSELSSSLEGVVLEGTASGVHQEESNESTFKNSNGLNSIPWNFLPRGLVNLGNLCFLNTTVQALLSCAPFFELLHELRNRDIPEVGYPTLRAFVDFISDFDVVTDSIDKMNEKTVLETGKPFRPIMFGSILKSFTPDIADNLSGVPLQNCIK